MVDKTYQNLDLTTFPQMMREKLVNASVPNLVFRDEEIRDDIIEERAAQSGPPVRIRRTESSEVEGGRRVLRPGGHRGPGGVGTPLAGEEKYRSSIEKDQVAEVSAALADVDYYLTGFIYRQDERSAGVHRRGFRYYHFQFRLTDARRGLVAWERTYYRKTEGVLQD